MSDLVDKTLKELTIDQLKKLLKKERKSSLYPLTLYHYTVIINIEDEARAKTKKTLRGLNKMLKTKTESGIGIKLWIEDNKIKGSLENIVNNVEVEEMEEQGFDCLYFGTAKVKGKKKSIFAKINKDIRNWLDKTEKQEKERACKVEIKSHKGSGWSSDNKYLEIEKKRMSDDQEKMLNTIKKNTKQSAVFAGGPEEIIVNNLSVETDKEYTLAELYEIVTNTDKHQEKIEKQKQREEERKEKFAEAKETGKKVLLSNRSVPCDGSATECSLDIVRVYAMPDGNKKSKRIHTHQGANKILDIEDQIMNILRQEFRDFEYNGDFSKLGLMNIIEIRANVWIVYFYDKEGCNFVAIVDVDSELASLYKRQYPNNPRLFR